MPLDRLLLKHHSLAIYDRYTQEYPRCGKRSSHMPVGLLSRVYGKYWMKMVALNGTPTIPTTSKPCAKFLAKNYEFG
jgi:hypothetical protein